MYCRPLRANFIGQSDTFMTESTYGGSPINNFKWLPITHFLDRVGSKIIKQFKILKKENI